MKSCLAKLHARTVDLPEGLKAMETVRTLMAGLKAGTASLCQIFLVKSTLSCLLADVDVTLLSSCIWLFRAYRPRSTTTRQSYSERLCSCRIEIPCQCEEGAQLADCQVFKDECVYTCACDSRTRLLQRLCLVGATAVCSNLTCLHTVVSSLSAMDGREEMSVRFVLFGNVVGFRSL